MSTQPLLSASVVDTLDNSCPLFQPGHPLRVQSPFTLRSNTEQSESLARPQDLFNTQMLVGNKNVQEVILLHELEQEFSEVIFKLTPVMKAKDAELYRHSLRVHSLALTLAPMLNLPQDEVLTIGLAAFFHDIGKMGINDAILKKASQLTHQEFEIVKRHPAYGAKMLSQFKILKNVIPSVYHHHECWDGRGYPDGISGEAIPLGARIVAIVDAFDAMTSYRNYQNRRTPLEALEELCRCAGTQFDAQLVRLFCDCFETTLVESIHER